MSLRGLHARRQPEAITKNRVQIGQLSNCQKMSVPTRDFGLVPGSALCLPQYFVILRIGERGVTHHSDGSHLTGGVVKLITICLVGGDVPL